MTEKLTLSVPLKFKRKVQLLSRKRKKSISALFEEFVERSIRCSYMEDQRCCGSRRLVTFG